MENKNYKLLDLMSLTIQLMKFQGLFIHRGKKTKNNNQVSSVVVVVEKDESCSLDSDFETYYKKHEITRRMSINIAHVFYCLFITLVKIYFLPLSGLLAYDKGFTEAVYGVSQAAPTNVSLTTSNGNKDKSIFVDILIYAATALVYIHIIITPFYFLVISGMKTCFYRTVLSYEYIENQLGQHLENNSDSNKTRFRVFRAFYTTIALSFSLIIFAYMTWSQANSIFTSDNIIRSVHVFMRILVYSAIIQDLASAWYLICTLILRVRHQIELFQRYINGLMIKDGSDFDVDQVKSLYGSLYEHTKVLDSWICYYYGFVYLTAIPAFCLLLYAVAVAKLNVDKIQNFSQLIAITSIELTLLTIVAVMFREKAGKILGRLFKVDLNKMKNESHVAKLSLFITQLKAEPIGITVNKWLLLESRTVFTIIGLIVSYFLLIVDMRDKMDL